MPRLSYITITCALLSFLLICVAFFLIRKPVGVSCPCSGTSGAWTLQGQGLQTESTPGTASIPVHIFEEHHEALLYWIPAVKEGLIRPTGNTLVHIDAHSDMAVPFIKDILPVGRLPKDEQEVTQMMQRNDVFIQAAVLSGLFDKVIWIYPSWLKDDVSSEAGPNQSHGLLQVTKNGKSRQEICTCDSDSDNCIYFIGSDADNFTMFKVARSKCDVKVSYSFSIVPEDKAVTFLREAVTPEDSVVLDIDEDYYGTEAAGTPLYMAGLSEKRVEMLTSFVYFVFCPNTSLQERAADSFFHHVVTKTLHFKEFCAESGKTDCKLDILTFTTEMLRELRMRGIDKFLCRKEGKSENKFKVVLRILNGYTVGQLQALRTVGICRVTSLRTYNVSEYPGMMVCQGGNTPNHTMVEFFTPSLHEVATRTATMTNILKSLSSTPRLVTVCRSGRDGYTPRSMATLIESDIISALKETFPGITDRSVFYDSQLLGGKDGWFSRYDVFMSIPEFRS